jgi:hypothetical protein
MQRWAVNTLSIIGIIMVSGFTLIASLYLLLLSMCAGSSGGPSGSGTPYLIGAIVVVVAGIWIIGWLGRVVSHSASDALATYPYTAAQSGHAVPAPAPPSARVPRAAQSQPLPLTPGNREAMNRLVWAMGAQIVVSILCWFLSQHFFWTAPSNVAPHNWVLLLGVPFLLYRVPYLILIYRFLTKPESRTLVYALVVPVILAFQAVFNLGVVIYTYVQNPAGFLLLLLPWSIHIVIVVLAWKAIRQAEIHPDSSSLFQAGVVTFVYFMVLHHASPLFYIYTRR